MFLDIAKAYNSLDRELLVKIIESNIKPSALYLLRQIIMKQSCLLYNITVDSEKGVAQGSVISPQLFNIYLDRLISTLKDELEGLSSIVCYADDSVLFRSFEFSKLTEIFARFGFKINATKSVRFRRRYDKKIPMRKRTKYLGYGVDHTGKPFGKCKAKQSIEESAKKISKIGLWNDPKAQRMLAACCEGRAKFYQEKQMLDLDCGKLIKKSLKWNKSLTNDTACMVAEAILKKIRVGANEDKLRAYCCSLRQLFKLAECSSWQE